MVKYGSIEYFELLGFSNKLKNRHLDKLDLVNLDRLRDEVIMKIEAIKLQENERIANAKTPNHDPHPKG